MQANATRRSTKTGQDGRASFRDNLPGGDYVAVLQSDGTYTITSEDGVGIPIMSEMPAGVRGNEDQVGREWLEQALEKFRLSEKDGHLPPVHAQHHDIGRENYQIGFLRLTNVDKVELAGKPLDTLFAEIAGVEEKNLPALENLELPYRSPEVSWKKGEIQSLALMSDDAPFTKYPMTRVKKRVTPTTTRFTAADSPLVALSAFGADDARILFCFRDCTRLRDEGDEEGGEEKPKKDKDEGDEPETKEDDMSNEKLQAELDTLKKSIEATNAAVAKLIPAKPDSNAPVEIGKLQEQIASLRGEVTGLREKETAREKETGIQKLVDREAAALRKDGWTLSDTTLTHMREAAEAGGTQEGAEKGLKAFCASFRAVAPKDPPSLDRLGGGGSGRASDQTLPAEVMAYANKGPELFHAAKEEHEHYAKLRGSGIALREPLATFLDVNVTANLRRKSEQKAKATA